MADVNLAAQRTSYGLVFLLIFIAAIAYILKLSPPFFPVDDAYIVLHNVQVLHLGHDANYAHSNALDGTTSSIFLSLLFLFSFFLKPIWADIVLNWLALFFYLTGLLRLAFIYRAQLWQAWSLVILGAIVAYMPLQLLNGLETTLALATVTWVLVCAAKYKQPGYFLGLNLLSGCLPFLRPELAIFSVLMLAWQVIRFRKQADFIKRSLLAAGIMLLAAMPWLLWNFSSVGTFYPETIMAKKWFYAQAGWPLLQKLLKARQGLSSFANAFNIVSVILALALLMVTSLGRMILLAMVCILSLFIWNLPSALVFNYQRYLYIFVPFLLYGIISGSTHRKMGVRYVANFALILSLIVSLIYFPARWQFYLQLRNYYVQQWTPLVNWLKQHVPADKIIAVHDAGYLSYATHYRLVDVVGLKSPQNLVWHRRYTYPSRGRLREQALADILQQNAVNYLIVTHEWDTLFGITSGLRQRGWKLQPVYAIPQGYAVYQLRGVSIPR